MVKRKVKSCKFHIVWTPKYRKNFVKGLIKFWVEKSLNEEAIKLGIEIEEMEVMPDHVHLFVSIKPQDSVSNVVQKLKGFSSYTTRKHLNLSKKYKHLWGDGYFCESVGHISESTVRKYINEQWKHYKG